MVVLNQPVPLALELVFLARVAPLERFGAGIDPHLAQPFALRLHAHHIHALALRDMGKQFEIDQRGDCLLYTSEAADDM
jgi:hypothetical protein